MPRRGYTDLTCKQRESRQAQQQTPRQCIVCCYSSYATGWGDVEFAVAPWGSSLELCVAVADVAEECLLGPPPRVFRTLSQPFAVSAAHATAGIHNLSFLAAANRRRKVGAHEHDTHERIWW